MVRLGRDRRGSVAAMMAVMLVPILLFVGSAIDLSRVYAVKARLQQACDAGVLAGKKAMTTTSGTDLDATAKAQATAYFRANFRTYQDAADPTNPVKQGAPGWMGTTAALDGVNKGKYLPVFQPGKTDDNQVSGTAMVRVPMAVMRIFGAQPVTLTATCEARYDTFDTDILFVLDVTGSMACLTGNTNCNDYVTKHLAVASDGSPYITEEPATGTDQSRISGLRTAVVSFFDALTSPANGFNPATANVRIGFLPYNGTVNVGKLLKGLGGYLQTNPTYQSRTYDGEGPKSAVATTSKPNSCTTTNNVRTPTAANTYNVDSSNNYYATYTSTVPAGSNCTVKTQTVRPIITYKPWPWPTTDYLESKVVPNPTQWDGSNSTVWAGCVEERLDANSAGLNSLTNFNYASPPKDLDPDAKPGAADGWAPYWPDVEYPRSAVANEQAYDMRTPYSRGGNIGLGWVANGVYYYNGIACPLQAKPLNNADTTLQANADKTAADAAKAQVRANIQAYLKDTNAFRAFGTTYHDVGMVWGARMIAPKGVFGEGTAAWPGHKEPNRIIVFLTDGDMESDPGTDGLVYSAYGMEYLDRRVGNGATSRSNPDLDSYHDTRFLAACQLAKNRKITIFTVAYAKSTTSQLTSCASLPGYAYSASNAANLTTQFQLIASQVAFLRVSK